LEVSVNDTIVIIGLLVAVALALLEEFRSQGSSMVGWSAVVGFGVLLLARLVG
jgi:hypothetical protein